MADCRPCSAVQDSGTFWMASGQFWRLVHEAANLLKVRLVCEQSVPTWSWMLKSRCSCSARSRASLLSCASRRCMRASTPMGLCWCAAAGSCSFPAPTWTQGQQSPQVERSVAQYSSTLIAVSRFGRWDQAEQPRLELGRSQRSKHCPSSLETKCCILQVRNATAASSKCAIYK